MLYQETKRPRDIAKDFILEYRNLHEDSLDILDFAAYGLTEYV